MPCSQAQFAEFSLGGRILQAFHTTAPFPVTQPASFVALYKAEGRPSIPPEHLLRATLLQMLYTVRSERQLVERFEFVLLFRWFVEPRNDDAVFDASVFSKTAITF